MSATKPCKNGSSESEEAIRSFQKAEKVLRDRTFRRRVTESVWLLPFALLLLVALWFVPGAEGAKLWGGLLATCVSGYVIVEWNNRNSLLRVRSRMSSSVFFLLMAMCPFLHLWSTHMVPPICLVLALFLLFETYQRPRAEGYTFHSFLCVGLGSMFFPPMLLSVPLLYFSMMVHLRSLTWRTFAAGLLGLLLPLWGYLGWAIWQNRLGAAFFELQGAMEFVPPVYPSLQSASTVSALYVLSMALMAVLHYVRTAFNDKIKVRMYFYTIIFQVLLYAVLLVAQPQWGDAALRVLIAVSAPLVAHHLTLGRGFKVNVWFYVALAGWLVLSVYNRL